MTLSDFAQNQLQLPQLPLPQLETTFNEYLRMLKPLLTANQFEEARLHVADFLKPNGFGERLQRRLKDATVHGRQSQGNWLWQMAINYEFLQCRNPLLVKTNTFTLFRDDPTLVRASTITTPTTITTTISTTTSTTDPKQYSRQGVYTMPQIKRAARLINGFLDVRDAMNEGRYPEDQLSAGRVCLHQYRYLFGVARIPMLECDVLRGGNEQTYTNPVRHITVLINNQAYHMPVYTEEGKRATDADLEYQLWSIVRDVESRTRLDDPVCIWTGTERNHWAMARKRLIDHSDVNLASLHDIEESLFVVALDRFCGKDIAQQEGKRIVGLDESHRNGFSSNENRWFDKSFSLIIESDGRAGIQCEHAACDGLVPSKVAAEALRQPVQLVDTDATRHCHSNLAPVKALHFELDEQLYFMLSKARQETLDISNNSDSCCLQFNDYGSEFIKHVGHLSPDAYIEMAFQLAFFRMHNEFASACESIGMRGFIKGRTEIGRVFSMECRDWCIAMNDPETTVKERYNLLEKACLVHKDMIRRALRGEGASWHLHALYLMHREGEEHPVFTGTAAKEGNRWRIYAGSLNSAEAFYCGGFASCAKDGYGIGYHFRKNAINIGIECERKSSFTNSIAYRSTLTSVLREMADICNLVNDNDEMPSQQQSSAIQYDAYL